MGLIRFFSVLFMIYTFVLIIKRQKTGSCSIIFGGLTFFFVMFYNYLASVPMAYFKIMSFVLFSIMILMFGLMMGGLSYMLNKRNKTSIFISIITSSILMIDLFNRTGIILFVFVPVLLYKLQGKFNMLMK